VATSALLQAAQRAVPTAGGPVVETRLGRKTIVGTVVHEDDEVVRVEDFVGAQWTLPRGQHVLAPSSPRHQRAYRAAYFRALLGALETQVQRSVQDAGPLGPASTRRNDPAVRDLYRLVETPLGPYWFKARALPPQMTLQAWRRLEAELALAESLLARYACVVAVPTPGSLIPSRGELDTWRELRAEGLLDPEEAAELEVLEDFWRTYPDADRGLVDADGSIRPRFRNASR
jgi:hypothetical protein